MGCRRNEKMEKTIKLLNAKLSKCGLFQTTLANHSSYVSIFQRKRGRAFMNLPKTFRAKVNK
jgi:hypothetical protein